MHKDVYFNLKKCILEFNIKLIRKLENFKDKNVISN